MFPRHIFILALPALALTAAVTAQPAIGPFGPSRASQAAFGDSRDRVSVQVLVQPARVAPGDDFILAVVLDHDEEWHTHTNDPQVPAILGSSDNYFATAMHVEVPEGSPIVPFENWVQWPTPHVVEVAFGGTPVDYAVFGGETIIFIPASVSPDAPLGSTTLRLRPVFQACDATSCMMPTPMPPGTGPSLGWDDYGYEVTIEIVDPSTLGTAGDADSRFATFRGDTFARIHAGDSIPSGPVVFDAFGLAFTLDAGSPLGLTLLLAVAAIGGFLLNLTPCVLPVIPIKIMGLAHGAGNRRRTLVLGAWMTLGVLSLWLALGLAIATVSEFTATNQLFQYPAFNLTLGAFIAVMAVGMGGLFAVQVPRSIAAINPGHDSAHGSFLFGVMTGVLSTPCTAPFMGAAIAWAASQSAVLTLLTFTAIGMGMASPYLMLSAFPQLIERMPRAGAASELIKQLMGLLMLAAAAYFLGVGASGLAQAEGEPPSRVYLWVVVACTAIAGAWLAWRTFRITTRTGPRLTWGVLGLAMIVISAGAGEQLTDKGPIDWTYYTADRLADATAGGDVVVLEFTAEWCLNCKLLEQTVLNNEAVVALLSGDGVTPMKIDLTGRNISGNEKLAELGGLRIPLLVILDGSGDEIFRGDFYTATQVQDAIAAAREN